MRDTVISMMTNHRIKREVDPDITVFEKPA